jgi:6-phosphogluconolactonase
MKLRRTLSLMLATAAVTLTAATALAAEKEYFVYFGTYTKAPSKGIYRSRLDVATGHLSPAELAVEARDPAFLALHPNGKFLYAIDESSDPQKTPATGLSAYSLDATSGALTLLNQQTASGSGPCHLSVDHTGRTVLVANYGGGSVASVALAPDGKLGAVGSFFQHTGSSVNPARQKGPHAHEIVVSADNRFAFVPDLGLDQLKIYSLDAANAKLTAHTPAFAPIAAGSGPRHIAFHPGNKFAYVINEMLCTVTVLRYDDSKGAFTDLQTISTLPPGEAVPKGTSTAELQVHPSGKFLYGSNRGHNTIVVYAIDAANSQLTYVENVSTRGKTPRHFALDPTGTWLLAENQDSSDVSVFRIDAKTGRLTATDQLLKVPTPVCAVFVPIK